MNKKSLFLDEYCKTKSAGAVPNPTDKIVIVSLNKSTILSTTSSVFNFNDQITLQSSIKNNQKVRENNDTKINAKKTFSSIHITIWIIIAVIVGLIIPFICLGIFLLWRKKICCACESKNDFNDHICNYPDDVFEEDEKQSSSAQMVKNQLYGSVESDNVFYNEKIFSLQSDTTTPITPMEIIDEEWYEEGS